MTTIPPAVQRFVADQIPTVERLEILLLLAQSSRHWTVAEIEQKLRTTTDSIRRNLTALAAEGLVEKPPENPAAYRYCADHDADETVGKLAALYKIRRVTVIEMIYARKERVATR